MEEKIIALSTFFHTNDTITDIMSSRGTKKLVTTKPVDLFVKKGAAATKKVAEKKSKKKVVSSSEESSEESSSEDEIVIEETAPKKESATVPTDGLFKLGEGLVAIAEQLAVSNAASAKVLELLSEVITRLEVRDRKDEVESDLLVAVDDIIKRGESITIGAKSGIAATYSFASVDHLRDNMGMIATQANFAKSIASLQDDETEEDVVDETTIGVA